MMLLVRLERAGLPVGLTQHRIVPGRQFTWDRCWVAERVCVEIQGGIWIKSGHSSGTGIERDCLKASMAAALGWRCLPISKKMIESGEAVRLIAQALAPQQQPRDGAREE